MVPDTEEGINELKRLAELYQKINQIRKENSTGGKAVAQFIKDNIDTTASAKSRSVFVSQRLNIANRKSKAFLEAWESVVYTKEEDGAYLVLDNGNYVLNRYLFDTFRPKAEALAQHPEWIDTQRQQDINLMNAYFRTIPTKYWVQKEREMLEKAANDPTFDYEEWWRNNHIWNPYTRKYQLLDIWTTKEIKDELFENKEFEGVWEPRGRNRKRNVKDGKKEINGIVFDIPSENMRDPAYREDGTLQDNYIVGSTDTDGTNYDNTVQLNDYEKRMRDLIQTTLLNTADDPKTRRYFASGHMPARAKIIKSVTSRTVKEAAKMFGVSIDDNKVKRFYNEIGYSSEKMPNMPMTARLESKELGTETFSEPKPVLEEHTPEAIEKYKEELAKWTEKKNKVEENNRKIHQQLLDRDWISVMEEYLDRSAKHNAVLDNRERLFYLLNFIKTQQVPFRQHGFYGDLERDANNDIPEEPSYATTTDEDLLKQYTTFLRRLMFDQWKADEGVLTNIGKRLQGFASSSYMMLNYRGGVANVTVGETSILAEVAAREYMDKADWLFGTGQWIAGSIGFIRGMYDESSTNKQDAIVKFFGVLDYDEVTGVVTTLDMEKYSERVRSFMFHPQAVGEHFMQNSVLFAMLHSHKIISLDEDSSGIGAAAMNKEEYIRYKEDKDLQELLTDEQRDKLKKYKENVCKDLNVLKEFAWWRKDVLAEVLGMYCTPEQREEFNKKRAERRKQYIKEFEERPNLYDQLERTEDGYLGFKADSPLAKLDEHLTQGGKVTAALELCGRFTERVRKVNNKIHGVYNKLGQAYIEGTWWGGLAMQYHKHLPMGLAKRFRSEGYYNETRGTVEKGIVQSLWDAFLNPYSLNNRMVQRKNKKFLDSNGMWTKKDVNGLQALLFHLTHTFQYLANISETWAIIPEYERANIRRNINEAVATLAAICLVIAILAAGDDDDDSIWYNFWVYEADRLSSEVFMYNPVGLYTEGKTLFSTPIAAQSILADGMKTVTNIISWMFDGEHDMYYHSGQFAGRNKLGVYFERRLPMWNGIRSIRDIPGNNHYYKRGTKVISLVDAKGIAKWLKGED
jgi:hypothetical protein